MSNQKTSSYSERLTQISELLKAMREEYFFPTHFRNMARDQLYCLTLEESFKHLNDEIDKLCKEMRDGA